MAEPNAKKYKPHVPYPQALNRPKAKTSETDDNLLDAFKKGDNNHSVDRCHQAYPFIR